MTKITPVILAGGSGSRLWPLSCDIEPKQFIPIIDKTSTFQQALLRVSNTNLFSQPIVVANQHFRFLCRHQCAEIFASPHILLEPEQRNSAPAIAAAVAYAQRQNPEAIILVLSSDHVIHDVACFIKTCENAVAAAQNGKIVTFGIQPATPSTEYGYICAGHEIAPGVHQVDAFIEKPPAAEALHYTSRGYLWNSGIFLFRADVLMEQLDRLAPDISTASRLSVDRAATDLKFVRLDAESFLTAPNISIDHAIMERTPHAAVVQSHFDWHDIGSWHGLQQSMSADCDGNTLIGHSHLENSSNSMIFNQNHFVIGHALHDMLVVATEHAILVTPREKAREVKNLASRIQAQSLLSEKSRAYRPWGYSENLKRGDNYQVKRLVIWPHEKLSLQKHEHRSEHWVIVRGTADVTVGDQALKLEIGQSIHVPVGAVHRLSNTSDEIIEVIETQTGNRLDESDIIRFDDIMIENEGTFAHCNASRSGRRILFN